ncbi:MAG TPA: P-loop NTPase fold protein [Thermoanaerobaculia bacterium]
MVDYTRFRIILDTPTDNPGLGFAAYGASLREVITTNDPRFAVGVFGSWGAGKTTLMRTVASSLESDAVIVVDFSAWRFEREPHLIVPLLDCIREALLRWAETRRTLKDRAFDTARTIGQATVALLSGFSLEVGLPEVVKASFDANKALEAGARMSEKEKQARVPRSFYQASFKALEEAFQEITNHGRDRRFVVFIDDLDRCLPEGALEVLESMKLFFDMPGFVFVVGLDQQVVERCIDAKYAKELAAGTQTHKELQIRGSDYIKKIFQVPFNLPRVSVQQIHDYVELLCNHGNLHPAQQDDLRIRTRPHLEYLATEQGINPREVKRYINAYTLVMKVTPDLDPDAVLALQTLRFRSDWTVALQLLTADGEAFTQALADPDPAAALANYDDELTGLPQAFFEYFGAGGPGNVICALGGDLQRYLSKGELARSTGTDVLEIVKQAMQTKGIIRTGGDFGQISNAKANLSVIQSMLTSSSAGAGGQMIMTTVDAMITRLGTAPGHPADLEQWRNDLLALASKLVRQARELYQNAA